MKFSLALALATLGGSTAFTTSPQLKATVAMRMAKSESLPFLDVPEFFDGSLPGDVGFDPLGFAKNKESLLSLREAEIKHARLAMLAAVS